MIDLKPYIEENKRHEFYKESVERYNALYSHWSGKYTPYIKELIEERRPAESEKIHKYREKIFISNTKGYFGRVISSLQKIRKSFDFSIEFEQSEVNSKFPNDETLQYYITDEYPKFGSLDNWFWSVVFAQQLIDSGAIVLFDVLNKNRPETEFYKPFGTVYNSDQIWDYKEDEFYILKSNEVNVFVEKNTKHSGNIFYHVTPTNIDKYTQVDMKGNYRVDEFIHNLGYLPVVCLHGIIEKTNAVNSLTASRLESMLPFLKEAVREYSDLQAEVVQHIHSTMWAISSNECKKCNGSGVIVKSKTAGGDKKCTACNGEGIYPFDPYKHISIKQGEVGSPNYPTPPAGYLTKPTDIVKIQAERVKGHIYDALSAINYEWLMSTPLNQSGTAKEVDRSELNNFVYSVAEDAIRVEEESIEICNDYRNSILVPDKEKRKELLPTIEVPTKYDIVSDTMIMADIKSMRDAKVNSRFITITEIDYIRKRFQADSDTVDLLSSTFILDPLSGTDEETISAQLMNGGISKQDYVVHCNIKKFIDKAMNENNEFLKLTYDEQMAKMYEYADIQIQANSASTQIKNLLGGN
jgi:hypothetical protein